MDANTNQNAFASSNQEEAKQSATQEEAKQSATQEEAKQSAPEPSNAQSSQIPLGRYGRKESEKKDRKYRYCNGSVFTKFSIWEDYSSPDSSDMDNGDVF
jgi:hypothetical protein